MAQFSFEFRVVETWTGFFEAENEQQAREMLANVAADKAEQSELPGYDEENHDLATEVIIDTLRSED